MFLKCFIAVLFLVFSVKVFAGTVYEVVGEHLIITTTPNATVQNLTADEVDHLKRSAIADRATEVLRQEAATIVNNATLVDWDTKISNLTAIYTDLTK